MVSTLYNHPSAAAASGVNAVGSFHFITIRRPDEASDRITRRRAKSHAVKHALENKRKLQQKSREHFHVTTAKGCARTPVMKRERAESTPSSLVSVSAGMLDPFDSLPVDSVRMQALLGNYKARKAPEPVFSIAEELAFQSFRSVFRTTAADPALLNAVMLSLTFAVTEGSIDSECLGYQGQALGYIREKMRSLDEATSESTIGAILLLAGVEARLGMTSQVQLHMNAVKRLLELCRSKSIYLTGGIKRAIFWQDLHSSILSGSSRIVDHTTFAELQWTRDPFVPNFFQVPPGFEMRSQLFGNDFLEVLKDVHALQCVRDASAASKCDMFVMAHINNHTASIQSRLVTISEKGPAIEASRLAAYVCSVMLCCTQWCALVIPDHISTQLLRNLQQTNEYSVWDDNRELLLWILYIGGAFAPYGPVRAEYIALLRSNAARFGDLHNRWPELLQVLKKFIWSEKAFASPIKAFWKKVSLD